MIARGVLLVVVALVLGWSAPAAVNSVAPEGPVGWSVATDGCGHGPAESGSAVPLGGPFLATAAHVVVQAREVVVTAGAGPSPATVVGIDSRRDLAILRVDGLAHREVQMASAEPGATVRLAILDREGLAILDREGAVATRAGGEIRGSAPTARSLSIIRRVSVRMRPVMSPVDAAPVRRDAYELSGTVEPGDSGGGVVDDAGRLVGIVFAAGRAGSSWATAATEVEALLSTSRTSGQIWTCDSSRSALTPGPE